MTIRPILRSLSLALSALFVPQLASCSLLVDASSTQCESDADCKSFASTVCKQNLCVAPTTTTGTTSAPECATTAECLAKGTGFENTYCDAARICVSMLSEDCTAVVAADGVSPITDPETILLGVLAPLSGTSKADGEARVAAVRLAAKELLQQAVGITTDPKKKPRPIGLAICDQTTDVERAATHLSVNLKVPAILGPGFSGASIKAAKSVTIPNGVLMMNPSATTPDLTTLEDNDLVWRTATPFTYEGEVMAALAAKTESDAPTRARLNLAAGDKIRIALLTKKDAYGGGLADLLTSTLVFNGTDVTGNGSTHFQRFDFPDLTADPNADTTPAVTGLIAFAPHIVMLLGTSEVIVQGMGPIEDGWPGAAIARPYYIVSQGARVTDLLLTVGANHTAHPDRKLSERIRVLAPDYNAQLYTGLATRYKGEFKVELPDIYGVTGAYDGFFLIAYALTTTGNGPITGATLAAGLRRLSPPLGGGAAGKTIDAGPAGLGPGSAELLAGRNIDYNGVTGTLDFDAHGDVASNYAVYCANASSGTPAYAPSGQSYDILGHTLVGAFAPCPAE